MSKTSMILRSILPIAAVALLSLPPAANADPPVVCSYPIPGLNCALVVTMTPVAPDPTVICPIGENVFELSFGLQSHPYDPEVLCVGGVPEPILVCGAWNTDLVLNINGTNYTLDVKKTWRWRDVYANCSRAQLY